MDIIAKLFGIKNSSSCVMGGTLIDTDVASGYNIDMYPPKNNAILTPYFGIFLYPTIKELQNVYSEGSFPLSMMNTWINGFVVNGRGYQSPINLCSKSMEILDKCSVMKTCQFPEFSDQNTLQTLFYFFKFYKNEESRILNLDTFRDEDKEKLILKGIVCPNWEKKPLQIRYVVRSTDNTSSDYLYFIGGSNDIIPDDPSDGIKEIQKTFELFNKQSALNKSLLNLNMIWHDMTRIELKEDEKALAKLFRLISGYIYIRNYLYYAYTELKIEYLVEFNGPIIKKVPIKKVLELYEEVYQYSKTIILIAGKRREQIYK